MAEYHRLPEGRRKRTAGSILLRVLIWLRRLYDPLHRILYRVQYSTMTRTFRKMLRQEKKLEDD